MFRVNQPIYWMSDVGLRRSQHHGLRGVQRPNNSIQQLVSGTGVSSQVIDTKDGQRTQGMSTNQTTSGCQREVLLGANTGRR